MMSKESVINELKRKAILSYSKAIISKDTRSKDEAVIDSILFSWLESEEDFGNRYSSFLELDRLLSSSGLFDVVESISQGNSHQIDQAIEIYSGLVKDNEYLELIKNAGYSLPTSFSERENYINGSLSDKVSFYHTFKTRLEELNQHLREEGLSK